MHVLSAFQDERIEAELEVRTHGCGGNRAIGEVLAVCAWRGGGGGEIDEPRSARRHHRATRHSA